MSEECKTQENIVANYRKLKQKTEGKKNKEKINETWGVELELDCSQIHHCRSQKRWIQ